MINANDYETSEELDAAMAKLHHEQVSYIFKDKYESIKRDLEWINKFMGYDMTEALIKLDKSVVYYNADRIEEAAKRISISASIMKSTCRLIPKEGYEN